MANLIITVISIALIAVAALAALFYGGDAFSGSSAKANAALLLSQSRQLQSGYLQYMLAHGYQSYSSVETNLDAPFLENYLQFTPILNLITYSWNTSYAYVSPPAASILRHDTCNSTSLPQLLNGAPVLLTRSAFRADGKDIINYWMIPLANTTDCYTSIDISTAASVKNPLVQMCLQLNKMVTMPTGMSLAANGLPSSTGSVEASGSGGQDYYPGQYNYCMISADSGSGVGANNSLVYSYVN